MAGATLTTVDAVLKEYYLGPVQEQLNNEVLLLQRLESRSEDLVGKAAFVPLHYGRSTGVGAVGESAALPAAGNQSYARAEYDLKYLYGRLQVTGPSMAKTKNDAGAFLQTLKGEMDGVRNDLRKDLARQVYGTGDGVIATATAQTWTSSAATTNTLTLASWEPLQKGQIYVGQTIDLVSYSSGAPTLLVTGSATVTAITIAAAATSTIDLSFSSQTPTSAWATATIVRAGVITTQNRYAQGTRSNEVDGLRRIITGTAPSSSSAGNSGYQTVGKIDAYANSYWDNQRVSVSGALTIMKIQQALNLARQKAAMPSLMITSLGVQREFYRLLQANQQFVEPGKTNYEAGFSTLMYAGMPVVADIDAPWSTMYVLDESTMKVFSDQDFHFLDGDGQTLRQVSNYDAYEAIMVRYMNLGTTNRSKNVVLTGITVDGSTDAGF
jgi:hypothetical protein